MVAPNSITISDYQTTGMKRYDPAVQTANTGNPQPTQQLSNHTSAANDRLRHLASGTDGQTDRSQNHLFTPHSSRRDMPKACMSILPVSEYVSKHQTYLTG